MENAGAPSKEARTAAVLGKSLSTTCTLRCGHPATKVSAESVVTISTLLRVLRRRHRSTSKHLRYAVEASMPTRKRSMSDDDANGDLTSFGTSGSPSTWR